MPLARALAQKKVIVRETGSVSKLTIENLSDEEVYVQAGEIVKGGQQDRVLSMDLVLPPKSGRVDVGVLLRRERTLAEEGSRRPPTGSRAPSRTWRTRT